MKHERIDTAPNAFLKLRQITGLSVKDFAARTGMQEWWIRECEKKWDQLSLFMFLQYAKQAGITLYGQESVDELERHRVGQ